MKGWKRKAFINIAELLAWAEPCEEIEKSMIVREITAITNHRWGKKEERAAWEAFLNRL